MSAPLADFLYALPAYPLLLLLHATTSFFACSQRTRHTDTVSTAAKYLVRLQRISPVVWQQMGEFSLGAKVVGGESLKNIMCFRKKVRWASINNFAWLAACECKGNILGDLDFFICCKLTHFWNLMFVQQGERMGKIKHVSCNSFWLVDSSRAGKSNMEF